MPDSPLTELSVPLDYRSTEILSLSCLILIRHKTAIAATRSCHARARPSPCCDCLTTYQRDRKL